MLVRNKVADYAKWKPVFEEMASVRKSSGSKGENVFRNADNPNELFVLLEWDNLEMARQFAQSQELREAMQRAGVVDKPDINFLEKI
jgi:heme-degrading monooxygenase HmoA